MSLEENLINRIDRLVKKQDRIYKLVSLLQPCTEEEQDYVKEIMELCEN